MVKKRIRKFYNKIGDHGSEIIFGILSGLGLTFAVSALITALTMIVSILQNYFTILYILLYLVILVPTCIFYSKGWFRAVYLVSSLILLLIEIIY